MHEFQKIYTVIFPSVLELAEFKIITKIPWEALDVNNCSVTAKLTNEQLQLVNQFGGKIHNTSISHK